MTARSDRRGCWTFYKRRALPQKEAFIQQMLFGMERSLVTPNKARPAVVFLQGNRKEDVDIISLLCYNGGRGELSVGETSWSRCSRGAGPSDAIRASERVFPALASVKRWRFRSVRTYMSIAARVVPFSRSFRSLIKTRAALAKY